MKLRPLMLSRVLLPLMLLPLMLLSLMLLGASAAQASDEVPFITTPDHVTRAMLDVAAVKAGDVVIDLGSGDGRIVIMAARLGARGLGVEIVPELIAKSRDFARRAGVADRVEFKQQDLFDTPLQSATVVTMYLLPELNLKLRPRLLALAPGTRVVSHDWDMGEWLPDRTLTLDVPDKAVGREKMSRVHLWVVPARVHGLWCTKGARLAIDQRFQRYSATLTLDAQTTQPALVQDGVIDSADGMTLRPTREVLPGLTLHAAGDELRVGGVSGPLAATGLREGTRFTRAQPSGC